MKNLSKLIFTVFTAFVFGVTQAWPQAIDIPAATIKKIDSLCKQWDNTISPGCAIGIIRNDSIRNGKKEITGFEVDSDRLQHVWFKKMD
jgi:hypothetical protein